MDSDTESYIMLLLSDGNLPTGSFVASSGLEAYVKHGFFSLSTKTTAPSAPASTTATVNFIRDSVQSYARSTLPFIAAVYLASQQPEMRSLPMEEALKVAIRDVKALDDLYESTTLNHVARRASTAQGVALLTLLMRGLVKPTWLPSVDETGEDTRRERLESLADALKLEIRRGSVHGHLPICWSVLTAALGLSCKRSQHLFMFLHARSLLSASIRLNTIGPYAAQQLLLHAVRPLVDAAVAEASTSSIRFTVVPSNNSNQEVMNISDGDMLIYDSVEDGPVVTWPLGEVLAARHDLQHSRIFNS